MFVQRLKELRIAHHLQQKELAQKLFVDASTISQWERGKAKPDYQKQQMLADLFNVSLDYLTGRTNNRIDDAVLDKALTVDQDFLELAGNLHDAQIIQKKFDEKIRQFKEAAQKTELSPQDEGIALYEQLDDIDRAEIRGEMRQMLKNDKYNQENAKMA